MILFHKQIEEIAAAVTKDFNEFFYEKHAALETHFAQTTPIAQQKPRYLRCPYCQHNTLAVYEDTRSHVETKCKKCGQITVFDVLSMRRPRFHPQIRG